MAALLVVCVARHTALLAVEQGIRAAWCSKGFGSHAIRLRNGVPLQGNAPSLPHRKSTCISHTPTRNPL